MMHSNRPLPRRPRGAAPTLVLALACAALAAVCSLLAGAAAAPTREIGMADLRDKIEGGWAGQMIGVSYGAPTEFRSRAAIMAESAIPAWKPENVSNSLEQDDLYVDMTFAQVLDDKGLDASTADFGAMFRDARYPLWHANLAARRALKRGVPATESGTPKYNSPRRTPRASAPWKAEPSASTGGARSTPVHVGRHQAGHASSVPQLL